MRAPQRLLPLFVGLFLIACSSDDGTGPEPEPITSSSVVIEPKGGSVSVENEAGFSLRLTFPGGALLTPVRVTLKAAAVPAGSKARFIVVPAGLDLNKPVTFTVKLPDGKTPGARDGLVFTSGEAIRVPTDVDPVNRTLTATLYHLGFDLPAPAPLALDAAPRSDDDGEFIDVDAIECDFIREALDNQILRAQAFVGAFPPDLASPLILQYKTALAICTSPDSLAGATAALREYACSNINSAESQANSVQIQTAADLKQALGAVLAAEALSEVSGAGCSVQTETIETAFDEFLNAYIARINDPGFTRNFPTWDLLWKEIVKVVEVQALAEEFDVFRAKNKIKTELYPALYARIREVAGTACTNDENNEFLLDILTGGHNLAHPITASPGLPEFTGFTQADLIDEIHTCGGNMIAEAKSSANELLGSVTVNLSEEEGSLRVTSPGKIVLTSGVNSFTCGGIVTRPPIRVRAEIPGNLPVKQLGTLSNPLTVDVASTLSSLPQVGGTPPVAFDLVFERDREICNIAEPGVIELCRIHVDASGFVGHLDGTWGGECPSGTKNGTFECTLGADGSVTGTYAGDASGSITGTFSPNGEFLADANGTAGACTWTGTLTFSGPVIHVSGTWNCGAADCSGGYSGSSPDVDGGGD